MILNQPQRTIGTLIVAFLAVVHGFSASRKPRVAVIGGGWAGFSAADALSKANVTVELLDASPRGPGGLAGGWKSTKLNRTVEAGLHGFWREYLNTFDVMSSFVNVEEVLTEFTPSVLYSESGRVALAPVMGQSDSKSASTTTTSSSPNPLVIGRVLQAVLSGRDPKSVDGVESVLFHPLDLAVLSDFDEASPLSVTDRLSGIRLLQDWLDFIPDDANSWAKYDKVSAESLFRKAGVSDALYNEMISPLLHVLPMCPGYDCSAAAALSCFHVFALQSQGAFDVRWCRGSITEKIFRPWESHLLDAGVTVRSSSPVASIVEQPSGDFSVTVKNSTSLDFDAIILAVGIGAAQKIAKSFHPLSETGVDKLRGGVTCVCCRMFFDGPLPSQIANAMVDSPVAVCGARMGGLPELTETGFCIYDLSRLQDEFKTEAALEVDFFRADQFCDADDDTIKSLAVEAVCSTLNIDTFEPVEASVVRAKNAVSHFHPNSAQFCPPIRLRRGAYMCGDWIDRTGHAAWSTEKSVVTGKQAAKCLAQDFKLMVSESDAVATSPESDILRAFRQLSKSLNGSLYNPS